MQLGISKGTVAKAYELLTRDGLVHSNRKGGTRIAGGSPHPLSKRSSGTGMPRSAS